MTAIERTAYPLLNAQKTISSKTLQTCYALTEDELTHIKSRRRDSRTCLNYAIQLKTFQNLGYFVANEQVPQSIISHLRKQLEVPYNLQPYYQHVTTLTRHRQEIRQHLNIIPWGLKGGEPAAIELAQKASQTMNTPADIINAVIEGLVEKRYELPAFYTIDRLVSHVRSQVNGEIFQTIMNQLKGDGLIPIMDSLLQVPQGATYSPYQSLKSPPKSPRITHFKELILHNKWLTSLGPMEIYLQDLSKSKLDQFATESASLDISNVKDLTEEKKYTLIACLIYKAQQTTKDNLGMLFCKTLESVHRSAKSELVTLREIYAEKTQDIANLLLSVLEDLKENKDDTKKFVSQLNSRLQKHGGIEKITETCDRIVAYNSKNHFPLLWSYFKFKRPVFFDFISTIQLNSSTQNDSLVQAMNLLIENRYKRTETLIFPVDLDLNFTSEVWKNLIYVGKPQHKLFNRRYLELCVFTHLAHELHSTDIFIEGAEAFADYRKSLLSLDECGKIQKEYFEQTHMPSTADEFVEGLKNSLVKAAAEFDSLYPVLPDFVIDEEGIPTLKKTPTIKPTPQTVALVAQIQKGMPERRLLDILCSTHHLTGWGYEFGPLSGAESRFEQPLDNYILNAFCYGTGLGPTQTAKHVRSNITPSTLSWVNQRHVTVKSLDKAKDRVINYSKDFPITLAWGDGSRCAADGTLRNIYEDNLIAESHIRYVAKGGIAYNHISDTYIALFSTFIRCGLWEAVAIIDGLLKNESTIKPTTIHADTQGQSTVVFGLSYMLGIKLMPRIRNWKNLKFFRPDRCTKYNNVDSLFSDVINWDLIKTHWQDILQIVLSIKAGKVSSALLLRKLGTYSRKNRLYLAFQELGRVIRTQFLLEYLSNLELRETITATTNKVEAYNSLSEWVFFGAERVIVASNDPDEMEKAIKYNLLASNCVILQNMIDSSQVIHNLQSEGTKITKEDISRISPYMTAHIKRYGDYVIDLETKPEDASLIKNTPLFS